MNDRNDYDPLSADSTATNEPRIPLEVGEITDEMREFLLRIFEYGSLNDLSDRSEATGYKPTMSGLQYEDLTIILASAPEILRAMVHHPKLFSLITDIGIQLTGYGVLSPRERELAILRVAWLCQSPYQWGEHVLIGKKTGINNEEIERITQGSGVSGWTEHEQAIVRAAEELHGHANISDATWRILSKRFNSQQLLELIVVIGQYQTNAYFVNSMKFQLLSGNQGLNAR